jgi:putative ABC transport system permease protein
MELGFNHDNILVLSSASRLAPEQRHAIVEALRTNPGVADVGMSFRVPFDQGLSHALVQVPGQADSITLLWNAIDPGYPKLFGMKLLAGRLPSETRGDDQIHSMEPGTEPLNEGRNLLINAAAAHRMGWTPKQAVGQVILFNHAHVRIIGVLADAKVRGAREPIEEEAYPYVPDYPMQVAMRLRPGMISRTVNAIDHTWRAFSPSVAVKYNFLDDSFDRLYQADERQGEMFGAFVLVAIFIACLGLFGLAAFTAGRRTKEIGIRKVFGARIRDVVLLLLWQFSIPVLIANLIAWPVAWYYLHGWLQGFSYRISLSPLYFLGAGLVALVIAWATVFSHARRVAGANPIHALRYE